MHVNSTIASLRAQRAARQRASFRRTATTWPPRCWPPAPWPATPCASPAPPDGSANYSYTDAQQQPRHHVQPAARHQRLRADRRLLRLRRRRRASQQGLPAVGPLRPGQLPQRELPRRGPDPGHRAQQHRHHGRLLRRQGRSPERLLLRPTAITTPSTIRPTTRPTPLSTSCSASTTRASPSVSTWTRKEHPRLRLQHPHHRFHLLNTPGDTGTTAAGINDQGDVAGFATNNASGNTEAFLKLGNGKMTTSTSRARAPPGLGLNNGDEVVGFYTVGTGSGRRPTASPGRRATASRTSTIPTASVPPPSTASTTTATWSASTPTRPATPTGCSPCPGCPRGATSTQGAAIQGRDAVCAPALSAWSALPG